MSIIRAGSIAARQSAVTNTMLELLDERRDDYESLVRGIHDALVVHARLEDEHSEKAGRTKSTQNAIARKRFLAHELTNALRALSEFDGRYPR